MGICEYRLCIVVSALLFAQSAIADCDLSAVSSFAEEICGELNSIGSNMIVDVDGNIDAEIGGIIRKFAGGLDSDVQARVATEEYENVLREDLPDVLASTRSCKEKMVLVTIDRVCASPAPDTSACEDLKRSRRELLLRQDQLIDDIEDLTGEAKAERTGIYKANKIRLEELDNEILSTC